ncbi:MAG: hypothetical protein R2822_24655 [Spirosomataceae bacterium]
MVTYKDTAAPFRSNSALLPLVVPRRIEMGGKDVPTGVFVTIRAAKMGASSWSGNFEILPF